MITETEAGARSAAKGERVRFTNFQMGFEYRRSNVPADLIFIEGLFQATPGEKTAIEVRMNEITDARSAKCSSTPSAVSVKPVAL